MGILRRYSWVPLVDWERDTPSPFFTQLTHLASQSRPLGSCPLALNPGEVTVCSFIWLVQMCRSWRSRSHGVLEQRVVTGADDSVVSADEQLWFSSEELSEVYVAFPDGRRTPVSFQLSPLVADHHRHRVRQRHVQLTDNTPTVIHCVSKKVPTFKLSVTVKFHIRFPAVQKF